jgi:hypothetical protein
MAIQAGNRVPLMDEEACDAAPCSSRNSNDENVHSKALLYSVGAKERPTAQGKSAKQSFAVNRVGRNAFYAARNRNTGKDAAMSLWSIRYARNSIFLECTWISRTLDVSKELTPRRSSRRTRRSRLNGGAKLNLRRWSEIALPISNFQKGNKRMISRVKGYAFMCGFIRIRNSRHSRLGFCKDQYGKH